MKKLFLVSVLIYFLVACSPVYMPNNMNVPIIKSKGETHIEASAGSPAIQLQTAHSITNHFFVMANGSGSLILTKGFLGELGFGYFLPIGKTFSLNISSGYGVGSGKSEVDFVMGQGTLDHHYGNFTRYFIQSSINFSEEIYEIGFSFRHSFIHFSKYSEKLFYSGYPGPNNEYQNIVSNFLEPAMFIRLGNDKLKFTSQAGFSLIYFTNSTLVSTTYAPLFYSLGVHINLAKPKSSSKN